MLRVTFEHLGQELLVDGCRDDYEAFRQIVSSVAATGKTEEVTVTSLGTIPVVEFTVQKGTPPNRAEFVDGKVIISIAPELVTQFLSYLEFPEDCDLPKLPMKYHHHFDALAGQGEFIHEDTLPIVFALEPS